MHVIRDAETKVVQENIDMQTFPLQFPVIVKPTGRLGSSGVQRMEDAAELCKAITTYADDEHLLIEEYIQGREFSVESLIQQGTIIFMNVTQKRTNETDGNFFVEMGHTVPAANITENEPHTRLIQSMPSPLCNRCL